MIAVVDFPNAALLIDDGHHLCLTDHMFDRRIIFDRLDRSRRNFLLCQRLHSLSFNHFNMVDDQLVLYDLFFFDVA